MPLSTHFYYLTFLSPKYSFGLFLALGSSANLVKHHLEVFETISEGFMTSSKIDPKPFLALNISFGSSAYLTLEVLSEKI